MRRAARAFWRWLTSMRTALILLLLLAVAAVPGLGAARSATSASRTSTPTCATTRQLGPWLDRLWFFDVYASPWFSAIYLLLFVSLVGCLVPRLRQHLAQPRRARRRTPRPGWTGCRTRRGRAGDRDAGDAAAAIRGGAARASGGARSCASHDDGTVTVAAEKGYLKETGNLLFHFALLALLVGVALGRGTAGTATGWSWPATDYGVLQHRCSSTTSTGSGPRSAPATCRRSA